MNPIGWLLVGLGVYAGLGLVVGLAFAVFAGRRLDHRMHDSKRSVRLLLLPGAAMLWPLVLAKLIAGRSEPGS
ncbi:MAG: hypothetical protein AAGF47_02070 [Planctomycetota bacterium]